MTLLLIFMKLFVIVGAIGLPGIRLLAKAITAETIIDLTNRERVLRGLSDLRVNGRLTEAARAKARDMLQKAYFSHTSPQGITPWQWVQRAGYPYQKSAENLAVHYSTAEDVQGAWMASPSHRKNIINPDYQEIGVAVERGRFEGVETIVVVQLFGLPLENGQEIGGEARSAAVTNSVSQRVRFMPAASGVRIELPVATGTKAVLGLSDTKFATMFSRSGSHLESLIPYGDLHQNRIITIQETRVNRPAVKTEIALVVPGMDLVSVFAPTVRSPVSPRTFPWVRTVAAGLYLGVILFLCVVLVVYAVCVRRKPKIAVVSHVLVVLSTAVICLFII